MSGFTGANENVFVAEATNETVPVAAATCETVFAPVKPLTIEG